MGENHFFFSAPRLRLAKWTMSENGPRVNHASEGNEEKTTRQWSANQEEAGNEIWEKWEAHKSAGGEVFSAARLRLAKWTMSENGP